MSYLATPLPFPTIQPDGFPLMNGGPTFDPAKHLQIEYPDTVLSLHDLGYSDAQIADCPTDFGVTSVFRILSDEGAACLLEAAKQLEEFTTSNARIARNVRGGTYRSQFLRDLCLCEEVTDAMSHIAGLSLLPHTIPHQLGHLNYNPEVVGENVDKWHVDTLRFDYVMFVTDPKSVQGGEFQYYKGTKDEFQALRKSGQPLDDAKVISPDMPGPGYAVLQQGNMVVHRAKGLSAAGERITMVNGYVPRDISFPDFSRFDQLSLVDPPHIAASEYSRHLQWMARERLDAELRGFAYSADADAMAATFAQLSDKMDQSAQELREAGKSQVEHFGDS